jgi:hypothetical protein
LRFNSVLKKDSQKGKPGQALSYGYSHLSAQSADRWVVNQSSPSFVLIGAMFSDWRQLILAAASG